jgi:hypothetical protein
MGPYGKSEPSQQLKQQQGGASGGGGGGGGPRVEVINGKIVVMESSLEISQESGLLDGDYEEVVEGTHATAKYSSFTRRRYSQPWGIEETRRFYQVGREYGYYVRYMQYVL